MVLQRDFLMRMIQRLADAFLRIVAGKALQDPQQALNEIEDLVADAMGTSPHFVLGQGPEAIEMVEPSLAAQLGRLLLLHAKIADELGRDVAKRSRAMGFRALEVALRRPKADFARIAAEQLREHFETFREVPPKRLADACMAAHEVAVHCRDWSEAEDWLFWALEVEETEERTQAGVTFFEELSTLTDDELAEGNFTRAEVSEGISELTD